MNLLKIHAGMYLMIAMLLLTTNAFSQDPNFHIYLCFGQSNMEGAGTIETQDKTVDNRFRVMEAVNCSNLGRTKGSWYTAIPPLTRCWSGLSPVDYFGRTMVSSLPTNIRVGVINVSVGGCKIELFDKDNYQTYISTITEDWLKNIINEYGGNPYGRLVEMAQLAQKDGVIKGILLHQGESNTGDSQWPSKVKAIYNNLITDLGLDSTQVPLLAGEVVNVDQGGVCASMNSIIATLPKTLPNSYVISSSNCTDGADNLHFNSAGYRELGKRYALKMLTILAEASDKIAADSTGIRSITSAELSKEMGLGWNVGNSLEAIGGETAWGNPLISKRLIDSVKAAGFNVIRIPVAWSNFTNATAFTIDTVFMKRVEEVVNYVLANDMYAVMNLHWDGGWMQPTYAKQAYVNNRLATMWKQIAIQFRDYGDHLIFAGSNEVMVDGDYGTPKTEFNTVQNSFNQTFVSTVRATGGRNYYRYLAVQGFNTNIDYTYKFFILPADVVARKLFVEVHYYDPYNFTLNEDSKITQWGKYANQPTNTETWANESYADAQFHKMRSRFVNNGYGVILGEYGAMARLTLGSNDLNATHAEFRKYYMQYITQSIVKHELVPVYWDNGYPGDKSMGIFNRSTGAIANPEIVKAIVNTTDVINPVKIYTGSDDLKSGSSLKAYPSPLRDLLNIEINDHSIKNIQLFNSYGQMIKTLQVDQGTNTFNLSNLTSGLYFIEMSTPHGLITNKIIKK